MKLDLSSGARANLNGEPGIIMTYRAGDRHLYWSREGDEVGAVVLVSLRRDGVWREVGAPANSVGLSAPVKIVRPELDRVAVLA